MQTQREINVAKFKNNALEADGFDLVCGIVKHDKRLTIERCGEGTKADFVVYMAGDRAYAIGVQLKTTAKPILYAKTCWRYGFSDTDGYADLLLLCIAMDDAKRFWLMLGSDVGNRTSIKIPVKRQSERRIGWTDHEIHPMDLGDKLVRFLTCPVDKVVTKHANMFMEPCFEKGRAEYGAFQRLQAALPLDYTPARIEGSHYDYTVDGDRLQLKLATYDEETDRYNCNLQKANGRRGKDGRDHCQYAAGDFDYLLCQMPADQLVAYLIPMKVLLERGKTGRTVTNGPIQFYHHRPADKKKRKGFDLWRDEFLIDLSNSQTAISDYQRIVSKRRKTEDCS